MRKGNKIRVCQEAYANVWMGDERCSVLGVLLGRGRKLRDCGGGGVLWAFVLMTRVCVEVSEEWFLELELLGLACGSFELVDLDLVVCVLAYLESSVDLVVVLLSLSRLDSLYSQAVASSQSQPNFPYPKLPEAKQEKSQNHPQRTPIQ